MFQPDKLADLISRKAAPDPFTLESLIAWLEKQPGDKAYCYTDTGFCLISQYVLAECGIKEPNVGPETILDVRDNLIEIRVPAGWDDIAGDYPRTFGAALTRARAYRDAVSHDSSELRGE